VTIPGGNATQSFLLSFQSSAATILPAQPIGFTCDGTTPAPSVSGIDTVDLNFSSSPITDIIALAATQSGNGIVTLPFSSAGYGAFAIASVNAGVAGALTVSADTGGADLPLGMVICETDPATAQCLQAPASTVAVSFAAGATPTFSVFAQATGAIALAPATARIYVRFVDAGGVSHGSTSVAVMTD
jgi:hypothetical protein